MFQKVLVPIDGSEISTAALAYAVQVVGPETSVLLLQVVDRRVRVLLDGHGVPGGERALVEVRGTMIG